jgi:hypothetical protein
MNCKIIPFQLPLQPALPTIHGSVDYREWREQILMIDQLLVTSGAEIQFMETCLAGWLKEQKDGAIPSAKAQLSFQEQTRRALRCNIARTLLNEDFRGFAVRLADSFLLQSFCQISRLDLIKVPSKSTFERYSKWAGEEEIRALIAHVLRQGDREPQKLGLLEPLDLEVYFLDTTCVEANIHYPVDWVLFRDATRTLMGSVRLIRDMGLKHRMEEPESFVRRMNHLCIEMTHARAKEQNNRGRKTILRKMDKLVGVVRKHARRYRDLLDNQWHETDWTRPEAEQVLGRMDQILDQLPAARKQARERILNGKIPESSEKILSFYEPEVRIIVRRKAGAEVEFGNTLLLGESRQGLIVDWEYFAESAPADSKLLVPSLERTEKALDRKIKAIGADRGFDSKSNQEELSKRKTYNGVCPRVPEQLKKRHKSWKLREMLRRRAQTEGRIGIFKNNILGGPLLSKGFAHRNLAVGWGVLSHNLWVLVRLARQQQAEAGQKAA